ncbi:MFS transporter [Streptomyces sp. NPDC057496]|uniref:MFS transporter n=1 Tax=Streptomyces sp. NPDC057496 TaxID=3346149 RepID=UPI00369E837A
MDDKRAHVPTAPPDKTPSALSMITKVPGLAGILVWAFLARIPLGVLTLSLFLGTQNSDGSLRFAGTVSTACVIGLAVSAPVQGRLLDRHDLLQVITAFTVLNTLGLLALAAAPLSSYPGWSVVLLAFLQGATIPSLSSCTRLVLRTRVPEDNVDAAFTIDTVLLEGIYLLGPAAAAAAVVATGLRPLLIACAVLTAVGTAGFCRTARLRDLRTDAAADEQRTDAPSQGHRGNGLLRIGGFVVGMALLAAPFGILEVALTQRATEEHGSLTSVGVVLTMMGVGSIVGGLAYSSLRLRLGPRARFTILATGMGAGFSAGAFLHSPLALGTAALLAGLCVAPLAALNFRILDLASPPHLWMQVQSWGAVANTAGHAAGLSFAGQLAQTIGASATFASIAPLVLAALLVAAPALYRTTLTEAEAKP